MKQCKGCGAENEKQAKFCNECGKKFSDSVTQSSFAQFANLNLKKYSKFIIGLFKDKRVIWSAIGVVCILLLSIGITVYSSDLNRAKRYYKQKNVESFTELDLTNGALESFEKYLLKEATKTLDLFNENKITFKEAENVLSKVEMFASNKMSHLVEKLIKLDESKKAFHKGLNHKKAGNALLAFEEFKSVDPDDYYYTEAKANIDELKVDIVDELIKRADEFYHSKKYEEALRDIDEAIKLDGGSSKLKSIKTKYEADKAKAEEIAKKKALAAKQLVKGKKITTDYVKVVFVKSRFTTKILPDVTGTVYTYYRADSDKIFFDLEFTVKNIGKYELELNNIFNNVVLKYNDAYTYNSYSCYWTDGPDNITFVSSWDCLDPLNTTTYHVAIEVPRQIADDSKSIEVSLDVCGDEQILNFR